MKIVHIYNTANVPAIMAKGLRKKGHNVYVFSNDAGDYFRQGECYGGVHPIRGDPIPHALDNCKDAHIIHCHSIPHQIKKIRSKFPDKKIILEYHGNDKRKHTPEIEKLVDKILVATPTLLEEGWTYLPNPVDLTWWKKRKHYGDKYFWMKQWCGIDKGEIGMEWDIIEKTVKQFRDVNHVNLYIIKRWIFFTKYSNMQKWYDIYDVWVEYKPYVDYSKGRTLSMTAMEALACGLRVYYLAENLYIDDFPMEHDAVKVVDVLEQIYKELLK